MFSGVGGKSPLSQRVAHTAVCQLFKYHVRYDHPGKEAWKGTVVEIHVPGHINFKWNHSNLDDGRKPGRAAAQQAIAAYDEHIAASKGHKGKPKDDAYFINENPEKDERWRRLRDQYLKRAVVQRQGK
jgi:hypothetical protein